MTEEARRFGRILHALRSSRGQTLADVANATGISTAMLSRIERGERLPSPTLVEALARHFAVPVEALMRERMLSQIAARYGRYHDVVGEDLGQYVAPPSSSSLRFASDPWGAPPPESGVEAMAALAPPESWRSRAAALFRRAAEESPDTAPLEDLALELVAAATRLIELAETALERDLRESDASKSDASYRQEDLATALARLRVAAARLERKIR